MDKRREMSRASVAGVLRLAAAVALGPRPLTLSDVHTGDAALAHRARAALGQSGHQRVAVAVVADGRVTYAGLGGADERTSFEIGSFTKAMTGMLLADLAADGAVRLDQPVGDLAADTPLAGARATLTELAQHRSGLPRLPKGPGTIGRSLLANLTGGDPYVGTPQDVLAAAGRAGAPGGREPSYSNLGAAALGNALAAHAGTRYGDLLRRRLLEPLDMRRTRVVTSAADLPAGRAVGASARSGRTKDPWIAEGWAPAGVGTWSTAEDLAKLSAGVLDGSAPGAKAVEPTAPYGDGDRIGLFWITSEQSGRTLTWHNGGTGGFRSFVGLDRAAGRAVVVLSASTASVDAAGIELLTGEAP